MDLKRIRYFIAAAEEQNFRRAAERLHVAQPALSRQIASLEADLRVLLFEREKRRVRLTAAGEAYLADMRGVIGQMEAAVDHARRIAAGMKGTLRIGFHERAGREPIVSEAFLRFREHFPDVELRLAQMPSPAQFAALHAGTLDAGIVYMSEFEGRQFDSAHVATDRFHLAVSPQHPLAKRSSVRLNELGNENFIWLARSTNASYAEDLLRACLVGGLSPRITQEAQSETMTLNLVATGLGVAFVVSSSGESWRPDIQFVAVENLGHRLKLALAWPRGVTPIPALAQFVSLFSDLKR